MNFIIYLDFMKLILLPFNYFFSLNMLIDFRNHLMLFYH